MSKTRWEIRGAEFVNCNCAYGCPCQFNALPTDGVCHGIGAIAIESGYYGKTKLDGLNVVWLLSWPNPIHEGNGTSQVIVDERANAEQRRALVRILSGEDTEPGATHWQVFSTTMSTVLEPLFRPITFDINVAARTAKLSVPGLIDTRGAPIRNPVTGDMHRARIDLPHGFEYTVAELGSGTSAIGGSIPMTLTDSYGQFAHLYLSNVGNLLAKAA
jgi:hypothetical protein